MMPLFKDLLSFTDADQEAEESMESDALKAREESEEIREEASNSEDDNTTE